MALVQLQYQEQSNSLILLPSAAEIDVLIAVIILLIYKISSMPVAQVCQYVSTMSFVELARHKIKIQARQFKKVIHDVTG
jgi:hypothetical protein